MAIEAGGKEPGPAQLVKTIQEARDEGIGVIFVQHHGEPVVELELLERDRERRGRFVGGLDRDGLLEPVSLSAEEIGLPPAERRYYALELTAHRRFADNPMPLDE